MHQEIRSDFAEILLSDKFQVAFNIAKGSIPVKNGINMDKFDQCAQKSFADFNSGELVPSFTSNLASTSQLRNITIKIISDYFNNPNADAQSTVKYLSLAIRATRQADCWGNDG